MIQVLATNDNGVFIIRDGTLFQIDEVDNVGIPILASTKISSVSCSNLAVAAVSLNGEVYTWGTGYPGSLGHGKGTQRQPQPRLVENLRKYNVVSVAVGGHCVAITNKGVALSWGHNNYMQCATYSHGETVFEPHEIGLSDITWKLAAVGEYHTILVGTTSLGVDELHAVGCNEMGQLGLGIHEDIPQHTLVDMNNENIVSVATGSFHSLAVTATGRLYAWGSNKYGCLGLGIPGNKLALQGSSIFGSESSEPFSFPHAVDGYVVPRNMVNTPQEVIQFTLLDTNIAAVFAFEYASYAVTRKGEFYSWGQRIRRYPHVTLATTVHVPTIFPFFGQVKIKAVVMSNQFIAVMTTANVCHVTTDNVCQQFALNTVHDIVVGRRLPRAPAIWSDLELFRMSQRLREQLRERPPLVLHLSI